MLVGHGGHGAHPFGDRPDWVGWLVLAALAAGMWLLMPAGSAGALTFAI
ncbi:MAG: hypothetical protein QOI12_4897 [Alphaproteobacteria bacterium]|jgi:hypothetical protein|nr:hypothetical protein [Alphaproteobacteria bacterium]